MPAIPGANTTTYTLLSGDVGSNVFCRETATNDFGVAAANTNIVGPVAAAGAVDTPPVNAGGADLPAITPTTTSQGTVYTVTNGIWSGSPAPTFVRQWKSGATNVGTGATTYATVVGDIGASITCVVTANNTAGTSSATSNSVGPVTAAAWSPASLTGLTLWLDAHTGMFKTGGTAPATTTGDLVYYWHDQSTPTFIIGREGGPNKPALNTTGFNTSHPAVMFSTAGATGLDNYPEIAFFPGGTNVMSIFMVCRPTAPAAFEQLLSYLGTSAGSDYDNDASFAIQVRSTGVIEIVRNGPAVTLSTITFGTNYRLGVIFDGTNCSGYINNVLGTAGAVPATGTVTSPGRFCLGGINNPATVEMAEIVVTSTALNSTDRGLLDTYFQDKWGL